MIGTILNFTVSDFNSSLRLLIRFVIVSPYIKNKLLMGDIYCDQVGVGGSQLIASEISVILFPRVIFKIVKLSSGCLSGNFDIIDTSKSILPSSNYSNNKTYRQISSFIYFPFH